MPFSLMRVSRALLCMLFSLFAGWAFADDVSPDVRRFFRQHCYDCHANGAQAGRMDLQAITGGMSERPEVLAWTQIFDRVSRGEMPPSDQSRPAVADQRKFLDWIAPRLKVADQRQRETVQRRLNREAYQNTVRDLLALEINLKQLLPEDQQTGGFDNNGEALAISAELMGQYLKAAELAIDTAITHGERPATESFIVDPVNEIKKDIPRFFLQEDGRSVIFTTDNGNYSKISTRDKRISAAGRYRFRFEAATHFSEDPLVFNARVSDFHGIAPTNIDLGYFEAESKPKTFELEATVGVRSAIQFFVLGLPTWVNDASSGQFPGVGFGPVEITGPLFDQWPPASHQRLLGQVDLASGTVDDARQIVQRLMSRAFRRPVNDDEVARYLGLFNGRLAAGRSFEVSLKSALVAVLCSPNFLYLREDANKIGGKISDYELASRMSYFLWSSMPDEELLELARQKTLSKPKVLHAQVERMLKDSRHGRFVADFTGQWLRLRQIDATTPDPKVYTDFDDFLKISMVAESQGFFRKLLQDDLSIRNFLDSDFAMLNRRLAQHYEVPDVQGIEVRQVSLPQESVRGGVLTQGAVLKVTANGSSTSPVLRGVWVLENLLGQAVPPPPPNVGSIEPDTRGATTVREQLVKHRDDTSCSMCHQHIDPPGFALESFDPSGRFRKQYLRFYVEPQHADKGWGKVITAGDVEPSGELSTGGKFADVREFKQLLVKNEQRFARCLTEKLLTFALGRELGFSDREHVDRILKNCTSKGNGLRTLIHEIVESTLFVTP